MLPPEDHERTVGGTWLPVATPLSPDALPVRAGRLAVGAVSRAGAWLDVASGGSGRGRTPPGVEVALGAAEVVVTTAFRAVQVGWQVTAPVWSFVARPPLVPREYQPATVLAELEVRGRRYLHTSEQDTDAIVAALVPTVLAAVLDRVDLTDLVLQRVDLDRVVAAVDLEAAVRRLDLTALVIDNVDLDAIVADVDLDAVVARVDVDGIVDQVDMQAIIDRIDIVGLANYVIEEIDLPEIIRESTGTVASEAVRGVRMQSIEADQAIQRRIDRLLRRRRSSAEPLAGGSDGAGPEGLS